MEQNFIKERNDKINNLREGIYDLMEVLGVTLMEGIFALEVTKTELINDGLKDEGN